MNDGYSSFIVHRSSFIMPTTGVLLIQLGTPDAPTTPALRRYLRQFLSDPRVIEAPRLTWWFVLNLFILPTRPSRSAAKYRRIWDPATGSPLLHITRLQTEALQCALPDVPVRFGMQIGNPSVGSVVHEMISVGINRLIVLPMYPQYSATTTASALDTLFQALMRERRVPALWLQPYTDETLQRLAKEGAGRVFVAMPGFTTDCLETLDEIGNEAREIFLRAGGEQLRACPCLNAHSAWIEAMRTLVLEEARG